MKTIGTVVALALALLLAGCNEGASHGNLGAAAGATDAVNEASWDASTAPTDANAREVTDTDWYVASDDCRPLADVYGPLAPTLLAEIERGIETPTLSLADGVAKFKPIGVPPVVLMQGRERCRRTVDLLGRL